MPDWPAGNGAPSKLHSKPSAASLAVKVNSADRTPVTSCGAPVSLVVNGSGVGVAAGRGGGGGAGGAAGRVGGGVAASGVLSAAGAAGAAGAGGAAGLTGCTWAGGAEIVIV